MTRALRLPFSKLFTAFAVARLAREGRLDLEADARSYLPELPKFNEVIKVKNLVDHTSGLADCHPLPLGTNPSTLKEAVSGNLLRWVRYQRALHFTPGSAYEYSNTNYVVLSAIVARVCRGIPAPSRRRRSRLPPKRFCKVHGL